MAGAVLIATWWAPVSAQAVPAVSSAAGQTAASQAAAQRSQQLVLTSQTSWVTPGKPFVMHLSAGSPRTSELAVSVFPKLDSRSAFVQSSEGHLSGRPLASSGPAPLTSLPTDSQGALVQIPTDGSSPDGLDLTGCSSCEGVYPVRVELRDQAGNLLSQIVTHLVYANPPPATSRLRFALVQPFYATPHTGPGGSQLLTTSSAAGLSGLVDALQAYSDVPVVLDPSPQTLQALVSSGRPRDQATVASLARLAANPAHQVVSGPYAPVDLSEIAASGLDGELSKQLARGSQVLSNTLGIKRPSSPWVVTGSLDQAGAGLLASEHPSQVVVPDGDLAAVTSKLTPTSAFTLETRSGYAPEVVGADAGLGNHFTDGPAAVLAAHEMLADLATIYFDAPNATQPRAVVAQAPLSWTPDPAFLTTLLSGLANSPLVSPVSLDTLFGLFPAASQAQRGLSDSAATGSLPTGGIRSARERLGSFASAVGLTNPALVSMNDLLLGSESVELRNTARRHYLESFNETMKTQVGLLTLPPDRSITLTSRTGRIPITIVSSAPYPVHAVLEVASEKLTFLNGSSQLLSLHKRNYVEYFDVRTRASGDFPLRVTLVSPQGGLVLLEGHFTVRSTAASWLGIALSAGAGIFLLLWWARSWLRGRRNRNRRLVPTRG